MSIFSAFINYFQSKVAKEWQEGFISLFEKTPNSQLLDLGCFEGDFTEIVAKKVGTRSIHGVDALESIEKKARARGIEFHHSDLNKKLPFDNGVFDAVCASQIIEHISDTDVFVKEMHRVLKQGGYAVISTPNLASSHTIPLLMLGYQPFTAHVSDEAPWVGTLSIIKGTPEASIEIWHRRSFTLRALEDLLKYHGFTIEKSLGFGFFPFPALPQFICSWGKRYADNIVVKVRKGTKK
jgi:SAM-dependent methyltransferase